MVARWRAALQRWLPDTLFGRLALLLIVAVIVSHVLALTLMFELRPAHPGHPPGPQPPGVAADGHSLRLPPPGPEQGLWNAPPSLQLGLLLDISVRLAALVAVAWYTGHHEAEEITDGQLESVARLWLDAAPGRAQPGDPSAAGIHGRTDRWTRRVSSGATARSSSQFGN